LVNWTAVHRMIYSDCSAVNFAGFMGAGRPGQPANCTLFRCPSECKYAEANGIDEMNDGVLSVRLRRPLGQHENEVVGAFVIVGDIMNNDANANSHICRLNS
jgi:hypothetical protein